MKKMFNRLKKVIIPTTLSLGFIALSASACVSTKQSKENAFELNTKLITTNKAILEVSNKNISSSKDYSSIIVFLTNQSSNETKELLINKKNDKGLSTIELNDLVPNTVYNINKLIIDNQAYEQSFSFKTLDYQNHLKSFTHSYNNEHININLEFNSNHFALNYDTLVIKYKANDQLEQTHYQPINKNDLSNKSLKISFKPAITNRTWTLSELSLASKSNLNDLSKRAYINFREFNLNPINVPASKTSIKSYVYDFSEDQLLVKFSSLDQPFSGNEIVLLKLDDNKYLESKIEFNQNKEPIAKFNLKILGQKINFKVLKINLKNKPSKLINNINNSLDNTIYDNTLNDFIIKGSRSNSTSYIQDLNLQTLVKNSDLVFSAKLSNLVNSSHHTKVVLEFANEKAEKVFSEPSFISPTYKDELINASFTLKQQFNQSKELTFKQAWKYDLNNNKVLFSTPDHNQLTNKIFWLDSLVSTTNLDINQLEFYEPQNKSVKFKVPLSVDPKINLNQYKAKITLVDNNQKQHEFNNIKISSINDKVFIKETLTNLSKNTTYYLSSIYLINQLDQNIINLYFKTNGSDLETGLFSFKTLALDDNQTIEYNKAYLNKAVEYDTRVDNQLYWEHPKQEGQFNRYHSYYIPNNEAYQQAYDMTVSLRYRIKGNNGQDSVIQGTGWILDYIQPNDPNTYPTTFFIATNMHVAARFNYLEKEVLEGTSVPDPAYINDRKKDDGLYLVINPYLNKNDVSEQNNNLQNLSRDWIITKINDFALVYTALNFLDKNYLANYKLHSTNSYEPTKLPNHAKDFAVLKVVFNDERAARVITRDFYYKYKNKPYKFAKQSLLTNSIDELMKRSDFYIFGYPAGIPTINKPTTDTNFSNGAKLLINQAYNNYFLNKHNQIIPGIINGSITNNLLKFGRQTGFVDNYEYFNLMYSFKDSSLIGGSSGSVVLNDKKEIVGIHFAMVKPLDGSLAEPLIFEGYRINDQLILPAYDLINGGMVHQVYSYKQAFRKHFKNAKSWLFDSPPEWIDQIKIKEPINLKQIKPKASYLMNKQLISKSEYINQNQVANNPY